MRKLAFAARVAAWGAAAFVGTTVWLLVKGRRP